MTDYLEELLDQIVQEELREPAAQWLSGAVEPFGGDSRAPVASWGEGAAQEELWPLMDMADLQLPPALQGEMGEGAISPARAEQEENWPSELEPPDGGTRVPTGAGLFPGMGEPETEGARPAVREEERETPALLEGLLRGEGAARRARALAAGGDAAGIRTAGGRAGGALPPDAPLSGRTSFGGWPQGSQAGERDPALAVDRAFQRDSRRYDRGFSLY